MLKLARRMLKCKKGAALVEYSLLVAGVALIGAASVAVFGHKTNDMIAMVAAVLPGAHADDNGPINSGKIIEVIPEGGTPGNPIGLDIDGIIANNGTIRLGSNVGANGTTNTLSDLVVEP
jgi:Flp pilus assembly pilin Flp